MHFTQLINCAQEQRGGEGQREEAANLGATGLEVRRRQGAGKEPHSARRGLGGGAVRQDGGTRRGAERRRRRTMRSSARLEQEGMKSPNQVGFCDHKYLPSFLFSPPDSRSIPPNPPSAASERLAPPRATQRHSKLPSSATPCPPSAAWVRLRPALTA